MSIAREQDNNHKTFVRRKQSPPSCEPNGGNTASGCLLSKKVTIWIKGINKHQSTNVYIKRFHYRLWWYLASVVRASWEYVATVFHAICSFLTILYVPSSTYLVILYNKPAGGLQLCPEIDTREQHEETCEWQSSRHIEHKAGIHPKTMEVLQRGWIRNLLSSCVSVQSYHLNGGTV